MTTTWLKLLPLELDETKIIEPEDDVKSSETEVGCLSSDLKKLYSYKRALGEQGMRLSLEVSLRSDKVKKEEMVAQLCRLKMCADIANNLFWLAVNDEFNLWDKSDIGVRKGWIVVWYENPDNIEDLLHRFLGR